MAYGIKTGDMVRLIGVLAVAVAAAWALQVLEFGGSTVAGRIMWELAAAMIAGAGTGLVVTSEALRNAEKPANA